MGEQLVNVSQQLRLEGACIAIEEDSDVTTLVEIIVTNRSLIIVIVQSVGVSVISAVVHIVIQVEAFDVFISIALLYPLLPVPLGAPLYPPRVSPKHHVQHPPIDTIHLSCGGRQIIYEDIVNVR